MPVSSHSFNNRRHFLRQLSLTLGASAVGLGTSNLQAANKSGYKISLAQWSNHVALKGGNMDNLDWAKHTKDTYGIDALEYVNQFFAQGDRRKDPLGIQPKSQSYLAEMKKRTDDLGMTNHMKT